LFGLFGLLGFESGLPFDFDLGFAFVFEPGGQAPTVSPWRRCAARALWLTVIVTSGFVFECVWWQIVTLPAVVVVGAVVVVPVVVLVDVVVVVGVVVDVVLDVVVVVEAVDEVDVEVLVLVDVDVLVDVVVEPVVVVVVCCGVEWGLGPRTPRAAATPSPLSSASAASVTAKRAVRRGREFTAFLRGDLGVSLAEMPTEPQTCAPPRANPPFGRRATPRAACTPPPTR
jgi:hypothetical protein